MAETVAYRVDYYAPDGVDGTIHPAPNKDAALKLAREIATQRLKAESHIERVEVFAITYGATGPHAQLVGVYRYVGESGVRWNAHHSGTTHA